MIKILALDFDNTIYNPITNTFYNLPKLIRMLEKLNEKGIHVVIVTSRQSIGIEDLKRRLDWALGVNRSYLLPDHIYWIEQLTQRYPDRFSEKCTKADVLDVVVEDYNEDHLRPAEKYEVLFTDDLRHNIKDVSSVGYPTFDFRKVNIGHSGFRPPHNFLENIYMLATGESLDAIYSQSSYILHAKPVINKNRECFKRIGCTLI